MKSYDYEVILQVLDTDNDTKRNEVVHVSFASEKDKKDVETAAKNLFLISPNRREKDEITGSAVYLK